MRGGMPTRSDGHMVADGLLSGDAETFDELMEKITDLAARANVMADDA